ncbi:extracellular solute-binding protein [Yonghaparkia sp. Root332]|uniref:extracellular solute-binding protein n=1 Tax=Yonghaparkia sp. Root332 TaxID=1736516 RepID=UPI0006F88940|nr:extracellular solute-binding protein [Yonghaparkia sp. Root332]KQV26443.1 sugar ABC transporter substrate-binding protein [Yonghaparkia sp. Root332]
MRRTLRTTTTALVVTGALIGVAGCSAAGEESDDQTLTVSYIRTDAFTALDTLFQTVKTEFEDANPGVTVELQPVSAPDEDYKTRLALSHRSAETAPDVFYQDTTTIRADAEAGYLLALDDYLAEWEDWGQFSEAARTAGLGTDGSTYAVSLGTDTRALWYSIPVLEAAGIPTPWEPETWQDVLDMAEAVQTSDPEAVPFMLYSGTGTGEGSNMQGFYQLLYGTELGGDALFDSESGKWVVGSEGFVDALEFVDTVYSEGYSLPADQALDPNVWQSVFGELFPEGRLGATIEGSYTPSFWVEGGSFEWPEYADQMGATAFPTKNGDGEGVSMSGGWTLAVGAASEIPDLAFEFLTMALSKENSLSYVTENSQIAVRADVAAEPSYLESNPFVGAVTELVEITNFRPATSDYNQISAAVQNATEAVMTGQSTPEEAAAAYDRDVESIVGADGIIER